jgi:hypothetical protein
VKIVQKCRGQDWFNCELFALQNYKWQNPNLTLNALLILNLVEFFIIHQCQQHRQQKLASRLDDNCYLLCGKVYN